MAYLSHRYSGQRRFGSSAALWMKIWDYRGLIMTFSAAFHNPTGFIRWIKFFPATGCPAMCTTYSRIMMNPISATRNSSMDKISGKGQGLI